MTDTPVTSPVDDTPSDTPAPIEVPSEQKGTPAPDAPVGKATIENRPQRSSKAFDDILAETKAELAAKDAPPPKVEEPEEKAEDEPEEKPEDKPEDEKPEDEPEEKPEDKPEDEKPEPEEEPASDKTVAEQILELMRNPDMLERALRQAGVETIEELPFIKDIVGKRTQGAVDAAKAAQAKERFEETQVNAVLEKGRKAANEVVDLMAKLDKDLNEGAEEYHVPNTEYLVEKFNEYADGAVHAYHNKNFGEIAEVVYNYPEMKGLGDEQQAYLASFNGKPPAQWLEAHLDVERQNLWTMAQNDVAKKAEQIIEDRTKVLEEAHKVDIAALNEKLEKAAEKHEKALAKAVEKAQASTRAEVLAEFAKSGAPPRVPNKDNTRPVLDPDEIDIGDGSFESIWEGAKRASAKTGV